jgi:hypothetical protein
MSNKRYQKGRIKNTNQNVKITKQTFRDTIEPLIDQEGKRKFIFLKPSEVLWLSQMG